MADQIEHKKLWSKAEDADEPEAAEHSNPPILICPTSPIKSLEVSVARVKPCTAMKVNFICKPNQVWKSAAEGRRVAEG